MSPSGIFDRSLLKLEIDRESRMDLPPLPARMVMPPFGLDAAGNLIKQARSSTLIGVVKQLRASVMERAKKDLPEAITPEERAARLEAEANAAVEELAQRLNSAMPDSRYRVSPESLLDKNQYYSYEFSLFANEYAKQISGDPLFFYLRGVQTLPAGILNLIRPLALTNAYSILPRFSSKQSDADIRVHKSGNNFVHIEWRADKQLAGIPTEVHRRFIHMSCHAYQGMFSCVPYFHSGLPFASIEEIKCQLRGDPYCEWKMAWETPQSTGISGIFKKAALNLAAASVPIERAAFNPDGRKEEDLPPLPSRMVYPPFGLDASGNLIKQSRASSIIGVVEQLKASVMEREQKDLPKSLTPEERKARLENAALLAYVVVFVGQKVLAGQKLPLITLAGLVFFAFLDWLLLVWFWDPNYYYGIGWQNSTSMVFMIIMYGLAAAIYYGFSAYRKKQGIDVDKVYKEIPVE